MIELARLSILAGFLIFNYAIVRSAIDSTFLQHIGKEGYPYAWLGVAVGAILATSLFDIAARRLSLPKLFTIFALGVAGVLAALVLWWQQSGSGSALYALYVWKDVHIVVLLEILWGRANSTIPRETARWGYGLFCAAGSLGGITGGSLTALQAQSMGTDSIVWLSCGNLVFMAALGAVLFRGVRDPLRDVLADRKDQDGPSGVEVLRKSRMLPLLLAMVLLSQISITLIEYIYGGYMQATFPDRDERTAMMGLVNAGIDTSALVLQLSSGAALAMIGIRRTVILVPSLLLTGVLATVVHPVFFVVGGLRVASKAMDYSLFRAAKEILYIPLTYAEQSQGKGMVDMLGYRLAKAGAAAVVLAFTGMQTFVVIATCAAIGIWIAAAVLTAREYSRSGSPSF